MTICVAVQTHQGLSSIDRPEHDKPPQLGTFAKCKEGAKLTLTRVHVAIQDVRSKDGAVSQPGKFNHRYVQPLWRYGGRNDRIFLCGQQAGRVMVRDGNGAEQHVIQAASHNYAGTYGCDTELIQLSIKELPVLVSPATQVLDIVMCRAIAKHFDTDFCVSTGSGYGANLLALSALLTEDWLFILDEKSHNSMFVAAYLSAAKHVRKFRHNDMAHLEDILQQSDTEAQYVLVAVEGFYSMDGTTPDLGGLARLKEHYGFKLFADEAHSLIGLGSTGKGCVQRWNEIGSQPSVSSNVVDLRVATLSKALGAIGGIVCGSFEFEDRVKSRLQTMTQSGLEAITTAACVKTINILSQTTLVRRNLLRLRAMAIFCRRSLHQAGIYVYGDYDSPILPLFTGRPTRAAKLSHVLRQFGVVATPVSAPAVPFWESRVRICLSAAFGDEVVCELLRAVVRASRLVGLCKETLDMPQDFTHHDVEPTQQEEDEVQRSTDGIRQLILQSADAMNAEKELSQMSGVGHNVLELYGLGSGGARWVAGTTDLHLRLERSVSDLFRQQECLTYPDSYVGLISTVAALCRPVDGFDQHHVYITHDAASAIEDGIRVAPKKGLPTLKRYTDLASLLQQIQHCKVSAYVTIIVHSDDVISTTAMSKTLAQQTNTTILIHNESGFSKFARWSWGMESMAARLLMYGSFVKEFRLPGSYLVGDATLINELRYTSRGYMFSTSSQPYVTAMINAELAQL